MVVVWLILFVVVWLILFVFSFVLWKNGQENDEMGLETEKADEESKVSRKWWCVGGHFARRQVSRSSLSLGRVLPSTVSKHQAQRSLSTEQSDMNRNELALT